MTLGDLFMFVSSKENILEKEKEKNGAMSGTGSSSFTGMASSWQSMNSVRYEDNVPS